ncbi:MAG: transposase [Chitinophagales bacterium]
MLHAEQVYHIYNHAIGNENLFRNEENYAFFLRRYAYFIHPVARTYAYCLMPNHFHILVKIRSENEILNTFPKLKTLEKQDFDKFISKQFSNLFSSYTQSYNKVYHRKGSLFIKNFRRKEIRTDAYFTSVIQYIHKNPVHHGFTSELQSWYWTSYHSILSNKKTLLEKSEIINWFGNTAQFVMAHQMQDDNFTELSKDDFY